MKTTPQHQPMTSTTDEYLIELALQSILTVARMPKDLRDLIYEAALLEKQRREQVAERLKLGEPFKTSP